MYLIRVNHSSVSENVHCTAYELIKAVVSQLYTAGPPLRLRRLPALPFRADRAQRSCFKLREACEYTLEPLIDLVQLSRLQ